MADRSEDIVRQRLRKLDKIRARGIDPYPHRYRRSHTLQEAATLFQRWEAGDVATAPEVKVAGRLIAHRPMGKATFLDIRDGSGKIQLYLRKDLLGEEKYSLFKDFDVGDIIGASGWLFRTRTGELSVEATDLSMLSKSLQPLPEKWHGLTDVEKRYRQRYLDLIASDTTRHIFGVRTKIISGIRRFLDQRGFLEVETPILQSSAGGALAKPFTTHHNALDRDLHLRIAIELHLKRLIVGGFDKVYEIGRVFRNEGISTKHNPEYTLLESYEAYTDYNDVMAMVEEMVSTIAQEVLGTQQIVFADETIDFSPPWRRVTLREEILERSEIDFEKYHDAESLRRQMEAKGVEVDQNMGRGKLIDELLSTFVEPKLVQPTFVMDYPIELSPLAKRKPDSERLVERFEAFIGGIEVANAFTELNDPREQRQRFEEQERLRALMGDEEAERLDEDFLLALEHGMPPTGGLGIGVDRLVMLLTDQQSIREVILFPQLRAK